MSKITDIRGREIIDSRGNPTVEADVVLDSGIRGRAAVPSGASTGTREAVELRDNDPKRYGGKGVLRAVEHINTVLRQALLGVDPRDQGLVDERMIGLDGTENKARLGANAILGVSLATAHAAAADAREPLYRYLARLSGEQREPVMPVPMMNIINGGAHANNSLDMQEFMIIPVGAQSFRDALRCGAEVFHALKGLLQQRGMPTTVGDEGGFAPNLPSHEAALQLITEAIDKAGYQAGQDVLLALDCASSEFYKDGRYMLESENLQLSSGQFTDYLAALADNYPIVSIEDGMAESDWDGWKILTERLGPKIQIVGDDVFVTNTKILRDRAPHRQRHPHQAEPDRHAHETLRPSTWPTSAHGAVVSPLGETEDSTIADIAVASAATRSRPARCPAGPRRQYVSCCASRRAGRRRYAGARRSRQV
jgi:enolase